MPQNTSGYIYIYIRMYFHLHPDAFLFTSGCNFVLYKKKNIIFEKK